MGNIEEGDKNSKELKEEYYIQINSFPNNRRSNSSCFYYWLSIFYQIFNGNEVK